MQVCSLTIEYQAFQFVPSINIVEQFESILVIILQQISSILRSGGHRCMEYILCRVVESSCLLTHKYRSTHFLHDPPYHKTMKKYEDSQSMESFLFSPLKFTIQTWFCNCPQYLYLFHIVFECCGSLDCIL